MKKLKRTRDYVRYGDNQTVDIVGNLKINGKDIEHKTDIIREKANGTVQFAPTDAKATGIVVNEFETEFSGFPTEESVANVMSKYGNISSLSEEIHAESMNLVQITSKNTLGGQYGFSEISTNDLKTLSLDYETEYESVSRLNMVTPSNMGLKIAESTVDGQTSQQIILSTNGLTVGILDNEWIFADTMHPNDLVSFTLADMKKLKELISNG